MTQEEKQLLLKDLCARLPHGVKIKRSYIGAFGNIVTEEDILYGYDIDALTTEDEQWSTYKKWTIKPYLRPMSSMTEEEKKEYDILTPIVEVVFPCDAYPLIDWLNKKMFDYRGLIPMGLALEAPEEMYKKD